MTVGTRTLRVLFLRHGEIASHRGDAPLTEAGARHAEDVGRRLLGHIPRGARVTFLHAPTLRTRQTAEAVRAGMARSRGDAELGSPLVEHAIRNPDLYVAGHRVEMVSSPEALATQMPADALGAAPVEEHPFFAPFWAAGDRIGYWLDAEDPPGERADECARRFFTFARSLRDADVRHTRAFVCVTHSGPLRAILGRYVLDHDPGEPEYAEAVHLELLTDGSITWRFRDAVNQM